MSEEQHASMRGPNGERLELKLGGKSIGVQAQSLVSILLLLCFGLALYLVWLAVDKRLEGLHDNHVRMFELLLNGQQHRQTEAQQMLRWLRVHDWNSGRDPADHLPLEVDPSSLPPKKPAP